MNSENFTSTTTTTTYHPQPPCSESCRKCRSDDIFRRYRRAGDTWHTVGISRPDKHETEWISEDWIEGKCKKECVSNVCRCCGFKWESEPADTKTSFLAEGLCKRDCCCIHN